jgi:hypothetical protein
MKDKIHTNLDDETDRETVTTEISNGTLSDHNTDEVLALILALERKDSTTMTDDQLWFKFLETSKRKLLTNPEKFMDLYGSWLCKHHNNDQEDEHICDFLLDLYVLFKMIFRKRKHSHSNCKSCRVRVD